MNCPNCTTPKPKLPITLTSREIAECVIQWVGLTHGLQPGAKLSVRRRKDTLVAEVRES